VSGCLSFGVGILPNGYANSIFKRSFNANLEVACSTILLRKRV
jgi:hypothetical protein